MFVDTENNSLGCIWKLLLMVQMVVQIMMAHNSLWAQLYSSQRHEYETGSNTPQLLLTSSGILRDETVLPVV